MPSRLREQPAGEYDRVLGIEGFFEYIYALPAPFDRSVYGESRFRPEIVKFRDLLSAIRTFRTFADQKGNDVLRAGAFERLYDRTGTILKLRDELADGFASGKYAEKRQRVLGLAMEIFLRGEQVGGGRMEDFTRELKQLRLPLIKLGREYNTASDEKKITIRDSILSRGLPGDPVVRRMWGFKQYSR